MDDDYRKEVEEHSACTVTRHIRLQIYRCQECGERFTRDTGIPVNKDVEWHDDA